MPILFKSWSKKIADLEPDAVSYMIKGMDFLPKKVQEKFVRSFIQMKAPIVSALESDFPFALLASRRHERESLSSCRAGGEMTQHLQYVDAPRAEISGGCKIVHTVQ